MQWIEADTLRPQLARQFEQSFEVGEVPDPPVARRADAIELHREQPASVEIAVECPWRRHNQRRFLGTGGSIAQVQPVRPNRQIRRPDDDAVTGLAPRHNLRTRYDFPAQRWHGGLAEFGPRRLPGPDHYRLVKKRLRYPSRQGIENDFQRRGIRHMAVTLTVDKFGLDSEVSSLGEKVHSARALHATVRDVAKLSR